MIVVADTSPLDDLVQIDCDKLLRGIYGRIVVPAGVMQDHPSARAAVREWIAPIPAWVEMHEPTSAPDAELGYLGWGNRRQSRFSRKCGPICF